ncbi:MAG: PDZ domain-containing protein [Alkalibacterium sp.]|nr:PDZ domain-containing protein [Alkalibacterium sp.]
MKNKKYLKWILITMLLYLFFFVPIPYFIERPGNAVDLNPLIEVDGSSRDNEGRFMLTTVELFKATPFTYFYQFLPYHSIIREDQLLGQFEDYDEYRILQRYFMNNSIDMAKAAAFNESELPYDIDYLGVYVMSISEESLFRQELNLGDSIIEINNHPFLNTDEFIELVSQKEVGETISLMIERNDERSEVEGELILLESTGQPGIGISLVTRTQVATDPVVSINAGSIGGPSAGLMFALELYTQINDISLNGHHIAGTGTINEAGEVGRIGGVEKKVVAADREGADVFFVPDDPIDDELLEFMPDYTSNYAAAVVTAEDIDTDMEIVPVEHISDAIEYLNQISNQ